jgi:hypothetical protein
LSAGLAGGTDRSHSDASRGVECGWPAPHAEELSRLIGIN